MSARRTALLATLLATLAATLGSASAARAVTELPPPSPPDQATTLASTDAAVTSGSSTQPVNGSDVLDAAALPGADTSIESGLLPQAAVGLDPLVESNVLSSSRPVCWANYMWHQWGTWPYQQRITDTTYWCAVYNNHITYRTSTTTASGTLCGVDWRASQLIGGGVGRGFTYFTIRASAGFSCQTDIPWISIHKTHHEDVKRNDRGVTTVVGTG
jgi:hypothetical protein